MTFALPRSRVRPAPAALRADPRLLLRRAALGLALLLPATVGRGPAVLPIEEVGGRGPGYFWVCAACIAGGLGLIAAGEGAIIAAIWTKGGVGLIAGCATACYEAVT